jgi:Ser/Thr protein kinase RdoA (MazF antagonist)
MTIANFDQLPHAQQLPILLELARAALPLFNVPADAGLALINLSENATYKVEVGARKWALRVHRDGYHSFDAIRSELTWLMSLREQGVVTTPKPVPGRDGALIQLISHHRMVRPRHVVLFDWEEGSEPLIGNDLVPHFKTLGEAAARMHLHVQTWQRPEWFTRHVWNFETALGDEKPHWGRWRNGIGVDAKTEVIFERAVALIGKRLAGYGAAADRFGLVHADIRLANLLIDGNEVKVIDFDDCGFSWFMYDAATAVSFHEHEPQVPALLDAWVEGYRLVRELSEADQAEISTFVMLRRLLLIAWIGDRSETDLAKSMGQAYTEGTIPLCESYLSRMS